METSSRVALGTTLTSGRSVGGWANVPSETSCLPLLGATAYHHPKTSQVPLRFQRPTLPWGAWVGGSEMKGSGWTVPLSSCLSTAGSQNHPVS